MSASVSPFGGLRGLMHLRQIMSTIQMLVLPEQVVIPAAHAAFAEDGSLKEPLPARSEEHTSELQSLMRISYAVFCLKKKTRKKTLDRMTNIKYAHLKTNMLI